MRPIILLKKSSFNISKFVQHTKAGEDTRGRGYITNILAQSMVVVGAIAFISSAFKYLHTGEHPSGSSPLAALAFTLIFITLSLLSRRGKYKIVGLALIIMVMTGASYVTYRWSIDAPMGLLLFTLAIFMAGILIGARFTSFLTLAIIIFLCTLGLLQAQGILLPNIAWLYQGVEFGDVITFAAIFIVIGFISMLSNYEIDKSLQRAQISEAALRAEKSNLEIKIIERTRLLEHEHSARITELRKFAEFGRLSAGLLHDIANPLTAASIDLEVLESNQQSVLVKKAMNSIKILEDYVESARAQIQSRSEHKIFSISNEIVKVKTLLKHNAQKNSVEIVTSQLKDFNLYGDRFKFNQILANLIANAIDAYENVHSYNQKRRVVVSAKRSTSYIRITINDFGIGIKNSELKKVFQPFFSTKRSSGQNMGIGLATVKQVVEEDFGGRIFIKSAPSMGTKFIIDLQEHTELMRKDQS